MLDTLKKACDSGTQIIVFGAGEIGSKVIKILEKNNIRISFVCDNDVAKQNEVIYGYDVLGVDKIQDMSAIVVVASIYVKEMVSQLNELGIDSIVIYKEIFLKKNEQYEKLIFPCFTNPQVSIVLTAFNEWKYTYECLKSILCTKTAIEYEVVVGDNASTDETKDIEQYVENVTTIHYKENIGYLRNCNETTRMAKGKYIVLLSNDVKIISDYWMDRWMEMFERESSIGVVGGSTYDWELTDLKYGGRVTCSDEKINLISNDRLNGICDVGYVSPACICFRADVWREIGGYDERYIPAWWEDLDLYCSMRKLGYKVILDAETSYVHYGEITAIKDNTIIQKNMKKLMDKWSNDWQFVITK